MEWQKKIKEKKRRIKNLKCSLLSKYVIENKKKIVSCSPHFSIIPNHDVRIITNFFNNQLAVRKRKCAACLCDEKNKKFITNSDSVVSIFR